MPRALRKSYGGAVSDEQGALVTLAWKVDRGMVVGRGERLGVAGNRLLHQGLLLVVDLPLHSVRQHL